MYTKHDKTLLFAERSPPREKLLARARAVLQTKVIEHVKIFTSLEKNRKHNRKPHYAFTQNNLTGY